ncbi:ABC-type transport system, involved in lipoprotein release, permease component [Aquiflexum balticum DSM 16537]|uniref:ABC-type transport system, involved in lipoprotein release, permease component n=1 Tax=Aquiflexum balticum DSM 16537 TaxID=758820 RepID=A0A1W2H8Z0_9BACT|nr:ABC transporter permease [Aquiflexum balticum]SMD45345.1 ABC-type transport system, involved in lipoprotein release, permease component [Aquiflexum balticum DSM 16537]
MLKNYFKIAWRTLTRSKWIGVINILGLTIGVTAALLIFVVVQYELSYDKFLSNYNQIYRIVTQDHYDTATDYTPGVANPFPDALREEPLSFELVVPVVSHFSVQVNVLKGAGEEFDKYKSESFFSSTSDYAVLFDLEFLVGNASVLDLPDHVVLTKSEAEKYFGSWEIAQGKTLQLTNGVELLVGAVVKDIPENSNFGFNLMSSFETMRSHQDAFGYDLEEWGSTGSNFQVYVKTNPTTDLAKEKAQLADFSKKHFEGRSVSTKSHHLQPLGDIHFNPLYEPLTGRMVRQSTIKTLMLVGIFILIMASINFVNISTSQAIGRSKEIGVRKVMGGSKVQIALQSFGETFLTVLLASFFSFLLANFLLPFLDKIADVPATLSLLQWPIIAFISGLIGVLTLFSGFYPAIIVSKYQPVKALKNKFQSADIGGVSIRRGLVILQFTIAQVLMIGTLIAIKQMNLIQNMDLGFNKDAVYFIQVPSENSDTETRIDGFKEELLRIPGIIGASLASDVPSSGSNSATNFYFDNRNEDIIFPAFLKFADEAYFDLFEMEFVAGQAYVKSDSIRNVVINETMAKKLLIPSPEEAIGKNIRLGASEWVPISGVVKDFTVNSLREEMKQLVITTQKSRYSLVAVKLEGGINASKLADIQDQFENIYPEQIYTAEFLDESIAAFYENEQKLATVYKIFALLAILISCIGLYGLVSFMVGQKVKEIGIRKVLGATVSQITVMISKEFILMVLVAFTVAIPLAYYMVQEWLASFAYKTPISISLFVMVLLVSLLITAFTVGSKAIRAAIANPVNSLTDE